MDWEVVTTILAGLAFFVIPAGQLLQVRKTYRLGADRVGVSLRKELGNIARWIPWCLFALLSDPKWMFLLYGRWVALALDAVIIAQIKKPNLGRISLGFIALLAAALLGGIAVLIWRARPLFTPEQLEASSFVMQVVIVLAFLWNIFHTNKAGLRKARKNGGEDLSLAYSTALLVNFAVSFIYGMVHQEYWFAIIYSIVLVQEARITREILKS